MRHEIRVGSKKYYLEHNDNEDLLDVDSITQIDMSNLYGEAATIMAVMNRVGLMKAEVQKDVDSAQLECDVLGGQIKKKYRREAALTGGHFFLDGEIKVKSTEKALEDCFLTNTDWQDAKQEVIELRLYLASLQSVYWSLKSKDDKLKNFMSGVTPREFVSEIVEGKINGIIISK